MDEVVVEVDSRGRISLGKLRRDGVDRYLARIEGDGTIVLEPAVVMVKTEYEEHLAKLGL